MKKTNQTPDMSVNIAGIKMKNPVMPASGTFACGREYNELFDINNLGALVTKSVTLYPTMGNNPPRTCETASGVLNSIGLQNSGLNNFIKDDYPFLNKLKIPLIVSIAGKSEDEYSKIILRLNKLTKISAYEVNISCPNVHHQIIGKDLKMTEKLIKRLSRISRYPLIIKLTPNDVDIVEAAKVSEASGAKAISLVNTFAGMAIDIYTGKPKLGNITGGLSGPAIKPLALRMVYNISKTVKIPVIGLGGITNYEDALEFIIAGASAVQVGTANFLNPFSCIEIIEGMEDYMKKNKIRRIEDLKGSLKT
ncbi:MAG: dihydroorotate dehydrogenase [Armatimonadota bacterium]